LTSILINELTSSIRSLIGAVAVPNVILAVAELPKTRSGKVTRRVLRKIAEGDEKADLGDLSTLLDESVIAQLWKEISQWSRKKRSHYEHRLD
jgi:acetyl-CoA synthetase